MSRFYASIQGERGEATRQGHKSIEGHVRGWELGVKVYGCVRHDVDCFEVYITTGSNGRGQDRLIGTIIDGEFVT